MRLGLGIGLRLGLGLANPYPDQVAREGEEARLTSPAWSHVSAEAKQLVSAMLERRVDRRLTADEVLRHPWLASAVQAESARAEALSSPGPRALLAPGALAAAVADLGAPRASDGTTAEAEVEKEPRSDTTWSKISAARSNSNFLKGEIGIRRYYTAHERGSVAFAL